MGHTHTPDIIVDPDPHFTINTTTRAITKAEDNKKVSLIQYDHNSERFSFDIDRMIEGHDILDCNRIQIHYINMDSSNRSKRNIGLYPVEDLAVHPEDSTKATFTWLISEQATQCIGTLSFLVSFSCVNEDETLYRWNSSIYSLITIAPGINNNNSVVEVYADELLKWENYIVNNLDELETELKNVTIPAIVDECYIEREFATSAEVAGIFSLSTDDVEFPSLTNLENGSAEGALQQKDFIFRGMGEPGGRAYGAGSQSFGRAAKSYQCASFAAGNTVQSGMTEAEFNVYYWDNVNNKPLHNGKGKDANGNILDATGYKYSESYAASATFGEDNKSIGRALFTTGQSNINTGSCNAVSGKTNNVDGTMDIVHGESTDVTGDNNSIFAHNSNIKANGVFAAGNALMGNYGNQILLGSLNNNAKENLLELGCGQPILRNIIFEADFTNSDEIIIKPYYPSKPCAICIVGIYLDNYIIGNAKFYVALNGNQYFSTKIIAQHDYIVVNNVYTSNPLVIKPKTKGSTIRIECFAFQNKSASGNYQNFGVFVRHNSTDTYKADILNSYVNSQKNAFEVLWDGRAKVYTAPKEETDIVRLKELKERAIEKLYMHRIGISDTSASLVIYALASSKDNPYKNIQAVHSGLVNNRIPHIGVLTVTGHNSYTAVVNNTEGQYVFARMYDGEKVEYTFRDKSNVSNTFIEL